MEREGSTFEIGRSGSRGWKSFGRIWTRGVGGSWKLENFYGHHMRIIPNLRNRENVRPKLNIQKMFMKRKRGYMNAFSTPSFDRLFKMTPCFDSSLHRGIRYHWVLMYQFQKRIQNFVKNLKTLNYFHKTIHLRCYKGFWICLWVLFIMLAIELCINKIHFILFIGLQCNSRIVKRLWSHEELSQGEYQYINKSI